MLHHELSHRLGQRQQDCNQLASTTAGTHNHTRRTTTRDTTRKVGTCKTTTKRASYALPLYRADVLTRSLRPPFPVSPLDSPVVEPMPDDVKERGASLRGVGNEVCEMCTGIFQGKHQGRDASLTVFCVGGCDQNTTRSRSVDSPTPEGSEPKCSEAMMPFFSARAQHAAKSGNSGRLVHGHAVVFGLDNPDRRKPPVLKGRGDLKWTDTCERVTKTTPSGPAWRSISRNCLHPWRCQNRPQAGG